MADLVGQQLGNYRLTSFLGAGGFAHVYLGTHIHLGIPAAIKVLHESIIESEVEGFNKEAQKLANLKHPHIVRVLEFSVENQIPFLVMEYAPNGSLRNRHPRGSCLPLSTIVGYVNQIAPALQYIHDNKLIHRDVKPQNMLLDANDNVLLSDLGIAITAHSEASLSIQDRRGTPGYIAPEQYEGRAVQASDQYSLGIVVYEWICGARPFNDSPAYHLHVSPPPLHDKIPAIPPAVEQVVLKALARDPRQRFESIQAFANALSAEADMLTRFLSPVVPVQPHPQTSSRISRRTALSGLGAGLVIGGAAGSGITLLASTSTGKASTNSSTSQVPVIASGKWRTAPNLLYPRDSFSATTLKDGKLLVAGGHNEFGGYRTECEIFDPAHTTWSPTGKLNYGRCEHLAFLLPDGKVLVFGGYSGGSPLVETELYDPAAGNWTLTGSLSQQRTRIAAVQFQDGKVLVIGGWFGETYSTTELYNPTTGTWSFAGNMANIRFNHTAVLLANGKVLVAGGSTGNDYLTGAEVYDPTTKSWNPTGSMNVPRVALTSVLLHDGKVLATGGITPNGWTATAELYDPETGKWSMTGSMQYARQGFHGQSALLFANNTVLVVACDTFGTSELYNPASGTWNSLLSIGKPHCGGAVAQFASSQVMIAGGTDCSSSNTLISLAAIYAPGI